MSSFMKYVFEDTAERFGLGSSTRGDPAIVSGEVRSKDRTEAEAREACRRPFEPDEYWVNVFWNYKWNRLETDTNHTRIDDVYEEILAGFLHCQYLHTIKVMKTGNRGVRDTSAFNLEDDARAWAKETAHG